MSEALERTTERAFNECFPVPMETAVMMRQSTEQLGTYLVQMAQMLQMMQKRLDEMEENQKAVTVSHEDVKRINAMIRQRANGYCAQFGLTDPKDATAIRGAIKKAILARYGIKDLHDCPQIALGAVERQIDRWADIRIVMKIREKHREDGG